METSDGVGNLPKEISEYMRSLQKKSSASRVKNDPNTYKKMANLRHERKEELKIIVE
jgi:hypothetical protein